MTPLQFTWIQRTIRGAALLYNAGVITYAQYAAYVRRAESEAA